MLAVTAVVSMWYSSGAFLAVGGVQMSSKSQANSSEPKGERLQRYISRCGLASRRAAEKLIVEGRIAVNGKAVRELGRRVISGVDEVACDGELLRPPKQRVVIVLNKPTGTLCSESDPERRRLVHDLVPNDLALRSVGRLDFNTEGVLLLTNDGMLVERLSHHRNGVHRVYEARVRGIPGPETLAMLIRGVTLDDGPARVESVSVVKTTDRNAWLRLTLTEGRNREVRRLLERVGHPVMRLRRVGFAGITVKGLKPGHWRVLFDNEIAELESRGHVGAFELPPDPRRRSGTPAAPQARTKAPRQRGRGRGGKNNPRSQPKEASGPAKGKNRSRRSGRKP